MYHWSSEKMPKAFVWNTNKLIFPLFLGTQHSHEPHRERRMQHFLYCCALTRCCGNVFSAPLSCNGRLFLFRYSSFQPLCHIAPYQPPFLLRCDVPVMSVIVFVKGTSKSGWLRHPAFVPCGLGLALLFNCSLLRTARLECHGPSVGAPVLVCF